MYRKDARFLDLRSLATKNSYCSAEFPNSAEKRNGNLSLELRSLATEGTQEFPPLKKQHRNEESEMKNLFLTILLAFAFSACEKREPKYRIDGKSYCKQIFDERDNQITHFKNWELIENFYVSPDNKKMLVYHRPDKSPAFLITLYDLQSGKVVAECEPGWACFGVRWTKDYLIYTWATIGGGERFDYMDYKNLNLEKEINGPCFYEDPEDDILIGYAENVALSVDFYEYSTGREIKSVSVTEDFERENDHVHITRSVSDVTNVGKRKYKIEVCCFVDGKEDEDLFKTFIVEV